MTTSSTEVRVSVRPPSEAAGGRTMSLDVPTDLLARAERGDVRDAEFVACVRDSLPYAWQVISEVVAFRPSAVDSDSYRTFISPRGQLLNQSPELRDC